MFCITWNKLIFDNVVVHGVLLVFINMANIGLAVFGIFVKNSFATHVLTILITNGVLYTMFYIIMKVFEAKIIFIREYKFLNLTFDLGYVQRKNRPENATFDSLSFRVLDSRHVFLSFKCHYLGGKLILTQFKSLVKRT